MRIPRSRGAASGVLLVALGLWGGLIPFVGPYFDFVIGPDDAWDWTAGRFWLSVVPAVAAVLGGLILIRTRNRAEGSLGAWLAIAGGAWFVVGNPISELWNDGVRQAGPAMGGDAQRVFEELTYFYGLGALIVAIAAFAFGRLAVRSVRDAELASEREAERRGAADAPRAAGHERAAERRRIADEPRTVVHEREPGAPDAGAPLPPRDTVSLPPRGPAGAAGEPIAGEDRAAARTLVEPESPRRGRFFRRH